MLTNAITSTLDFFEVCTAITVRRPELENLGKKERKKKYLIIIIIFSSLLSLIVRYPLGIYVQGFPLMRGQVC